MPALNAQSAILDICREFPKGDRIGKSFLVVLGCPSGRYYLGTTLAKAAEILQESWSILSRDT